VPASRVRVIPNALDLRFVDSIADAAAIRKVRQGARLRDDEAVLLSVGRLERSKGFHVLLQALAAAREQGAFERHRWRWVIVGDGPYRRRLESLARLLSLQNEVQFCGRLADAEIHAWYELVTLFVHPTLYEGSSLVTLEAMAHRRAIVATNAGGLPDKVRANVNGWLVPPGDPGALAAAISGALADSDRLARFGGEGRAIVEREFSWDAAGDATVALYRALLSGQRVRSARP
jgi:glycosyltransferase involved in cell wall biosynthesis